MLDARFHGHDWPVDPAIEDNDLSGIAMAMATIIAKAL